MRGGGLDRGLSGLDGRHLSDHLISSSFADADLPMLRRQVFERAGEAGLAGPRRHDFVLAVHEIAANAVRHGGGAGRLDLWTDGDRIWFRVADRGAGPGLGEVRLPPPDQPGGRGLWIASRIVDELTVSASDVGTVVTGWLRPAAPPSSSI